MKNEQRITLSRAQWQAFMNRLYELDDRLEVRQDGRTYPPEQGVDAYVLSGHAEALQSAEVDGDLWGTLEDLEEQASSDQEAWQNIVNFYLDRGCVLVVVSGLEEPEEWIFSVPLATRLGLLPGGS